MTRQIALLALDAHIAFEMSTDISRLINIIRAVSYALFMILFLQEMTESQSTISVEVLSGYYLFLL